MSTLRDIIGRALYEEPPLDRDWDTLSEDQREPWRKDAERVVVAMQFPITTTPRRMAAALVYALGLIEASGEPDIDRLHDAMAWGLGKVDVRNRVLREHLEAALNSPEIPDGWECPIGQAGCTENCGSYGCGN